MKAKRKSEAETASERRQRIAEASETREQLARARGGLRIPINEKTLREGFTSEWHDVVHVVDGVDVRRVLPRVPELHSFPVEEIHEHKMIKRAGGLPLIVEGIAEMLPGVRFDKPETIPAPIKAIMRALKKRTPFGIVIMVDDEAWQIELRK